MLRPTIIPGSRLRVVNVPVSEGYAAVRYKNPGAQWPNMQAERYGMTGYGQLRDGNKIALFTHPVYGAAANMALLASAGYVGKTISEAQVKWSGQHRAGLPGWQGDRVITRAMMADPAFVVPFMKSMADAEAPGGSKVMPDSQWREAFDLYRETEKLPPPVAAPKARTATTGTIAAGGAAATAKTAQDSGIGAAMVVLVVAIIVAFVVWRLWPKKNDRPGVVPAAEPPATMPPSPVPPSPPDEKTEGKPS